jgi:phage gp36-like protein
MAYIDRQQVIDKVGTENFTAFFDEDASGDDSQITVRFNSSVATASQRVDGMLASVYKVPFAEPAPATVRDAALCFLCYMIWAKRYTPDIDNPYSGCQEFYMKLFDDIRINGTGLDASLDRAFTPGAVVYQGYSAITGTDCNGNQYNSL